MIMNNTENETWHKMGTNVSQNKKIQSYCPSMFLHIWFGGSAFHIAASFTRGLRRQNTNPKLNIKMFFIAFWKTNGDIHKLHILHCCSYFYCKNVIFALIMSILIHFLGQDQVKTHISNITHTTAWVIEDFIPLCLLVSEISLLHHVQ